MASDKYPRTLHHPHVEDVTHEVADKSAEDAWRAQGWRVTEPDVPDTAPELPAPARNDKK